MKKLLIGGALCAMLSMGAFANGDDEDSDWSKVQNYTCEKAFPADYDFTITKLCLEREVKNRSAIVDAYIERYSLCLSDEEKALIETPPSAKQLQIICDERAEK